MICTALRAEMICQACGLDKKLDKRELVEFLVRVTGQIEQTLQAKSQVCLDGHSPSFALQNVKRCLLPTPAALGRFFELITQTKNKRTVKTVPLLLVRVTGLEPAPPCKD